ncbi:ABC transporter ATP-binding protein [Streptomyces sp. NTH33]|uniref:ABC transporter ATP-binding protein n=1 Tax=Streptomyces sp. NTH33 TaxID=1735453 RepID=UPI000DA9F2BC|nr:ABC transporter ATP-binding protein [Streptomyces sp. NTH33]PZH16291.1 ABC transporter ATP-binding protein [Streptomyces sp. NTH33]
MDDDTANTVIRTSGLNKRFGPTTGVFDLDLEVRRGEVYGFLGPNGSGKTTTLRMLVGLIRPTSGTASVLGHPAGSRQSLRGVGALIESPALYPHLSGRDNLRVLAGYADVSAARVEKVLEEVGMTDRADTAFRSYSLGMKQRTGVAAALLKDPELLILDEPTNGLDPAGMADMRNLITGLRRENRTVLLSSHLLAEVEHLCDRAAVLRKGRLVASGTVAELRDRVSGGGLSVRTSSPERAAELAGALPGVRSVQVVDGELRIVIDLGEAAAVNRLLVENGIDVHELRQHSATLEDAFFDLVGGRTDAGRDRLEVNGS